MEMKTLIIGFYVDNETSLNPLASITDPINMKIMIHITMTVNININMSLNIEDKY